MANMARHSSQQNRQKNRGPNKRPNKHRKVDRINRGNAGSVSPPTAGGKHSRKQQNPDQQQVKKLRRFESVSVFEAQPGHLTQQQQLEAKLMQPQVSSHEKQINMNANGNEMAMSLASEIKPQLRSQQKELYNEIVHKWCSSDWSKL